MRVLLLHNRYRQQGGEERAVRDQFALLRRRGVEVELLERTSDGLGAARAARSMLSGGLDADEVGAAVARLGADVVHAHNVNPLFGWRALAAAREAGARTILHIHNFRLFCSIAVAYRDGGPCFRCHDGRTAPAVALRCRGSVAESAVYAASLSLHWRRLLDSADRVVAVSAATAARLRALGARREIDVLHNFVAGGGGPEVASRPRSQSQSPSRSGGDAAGLTRGHALVAGRLVEEKGFDTAIAAAGFAGVPLVIAGEGEDLPRLTRLAAGANVRFAGQVPQAELAALRAGALAVLVPSRWEEPCPYAVLDALAAGVPVIGSDRGGLPELLGGQGMLRADDVEGWARELRALRDSPALVAERSERALEAARERFGEDDYYARLTELYGWKR